MASYFDELSADTPAPLPVPQAGAAVPAMQDAPPMTGAPSPAAGAPSSPAAPGWFDQLISSGQEVGQGPPGPMRSAPVIDTVATGVSPLTAAFASLAPDDAGKLDLYAKATGIPRERWGYLKDGTAVYADPQGNIVSAIPSLGKSEGVFDTLQRFAPNLFKHAGPALPDLAAAGAGAAVGPTGTSIPVAAGVAGLTDWVRQKLANAFIGDDQRGIDWLNVGGHTLMGGVGQGVGVGLNRAVAESPIGLRASDRLAAMDPARRVQAAMLEQEAARRGVDLSAGQTTALSSILRQERQLARAPETTDRFAEFTRIQREERIPAAIRAEIDQISPERGETAVLRFRRGAEAVQEAAERARAARAAPLYEQMRAEPPFINDELRTLMQRPSMREAWNRARSLAAEEGRQLPNLIEVADDGAIRVTAAPDWASWDLIKRGLDARIEAAEAVGSGISRAEARNMRQTRRELLAQLDRANPTYAAARATYGTASDAVDMVLNGGVGMVAANDGPTNQWIVSRIFAGTRNSPLPEEVRRMRAQFASAGRIEDWNAGLASHLGDALARATKLESTNTPRDFAKLVWGDDVKRDVIREALGDDPARVEGFERLMQVVNASARALPEGSPTATDLAASQGLQTVGRGLQVAGHVLSPGSWATAGTRLVEGLDALRTPAARERLANALLSGNYARELQQLRMLTPTHERALTIVGNILARAGVSGARIGGEAATGLPLTGTPTEQPIPALGGAAGSGSRQ